MVAARQITGFVALTVAVVLVGTCSSGGDTAKPPPGPVGTGGPTAIGSTTTASTTTGPTTTGPTTTAPAPAPARITINFAGDISFESPRDQLLASDPGQILGPITPVLADADLTVANLETAVTGRGTPEPKAFTFRTSPGALDVLKAAGIDVASIANNHGLDYGPDGVPDALDAARTRDFPLLGIGWNEAEALEPFVTTVRGNTVGVIAATQVLDEELIPSWTATPDHPGLASAKRVDPFLEAVTDLRARVDTLVVFLHWGIERQDCPSPVQTELAEALANVGVDIVVGGHAHRPQGAGRLGDMIVNYGLGNFAFYAGTPEAARTGVFRVTVGGGAPAGYEWIPARIDSRGVPIPLEGDHAEAARDHWNQLRGCTGLEP